MPDQRTIFLATDGRFVTLGGNDSADLPAATAAQIKEQGLRGWVAIVNGNYYSRAKLTVSRVHAVEGGLDSEWDAAVAAFLAARPK